MRNLLCCYRTVRRPVCQRAVGRDAEKISPKIAAVGILVAVLNLVLVRSGREEQAMMTTLAGLVVVMMILVQEISGLFQLIKTLFDL